MSSTKKCGLKKFCRALCASLFLTIKGEGHDYIFSNKFSQDFIHFSLLSTAFLLGGGGGGAEIGNINLKIDSHSVLRAFFISGQLVLPH